MCPCCAGAGYVSDVGFSAGRLGVFAGFDARDFKLFSPVLTLWL